MDSQHPELDFLVENLYAANIHPENNQSLLRYGFSIGCLNFIYDRNITCEVVKNMAIYPVPNTPAWMLGLINLRGNLVPVFNLENYFEFEETADIHKLLLVLGKDEKAVAVQLKKYPQLLRNLKRLDTLPALIPQIEGNIVAAYQDQEEKVWLELDKENFFSTLGEEVCK